jgi:hypothetical protein
MGFNCPEFIKEFKRYVDNLKVKAILEVGSYSGELKNTVGADGIDVNPRLPDVEKCDIRDYKTDKRYDLVFSSGLLEHYSDNEIVDIIKAMAKVSNKYILNYVPNSNCLAYRNYKKRTNAEWKNELDFTEEALAMLHEKAGLEVVETGKAGKEWVKRFGRESSEPYLVFVLAKKKNGVGKKQWQTEGNNTVAEFAIPEE